MRAAELDDVDVEEGEVVAVLADGGAGGEAVALRVGAGERERARACCVKDRVDAGED